MAHFITTFKYTQQGKKGLLTQPDDRGAVLESMMKLMGAKMIGMYVTMGSEEVVVISEADDGIHLKTVAMVAEASGSITDIKTVQAWTSADFVTICEAAGKATGAYSPPGA
jgi:uncharacterized protein with GYD domain